MLNFLESMKDKADEDDLKAINEVENFISAKRYGLLWEEHEEFVDVQIAQKVPVFTEDKTKKIINDSEKPVHFLLEGDNLHSLYLLEKTHKGKIDLIIIDPPYNRGKDDFRYDDAIVDSGDEFRHSKWLSFMNKRLSQAKKLLSETGIIAINIDEHEVAPLIMLMEDIFGEQNNLGTIIWNKQNPKGDAHKISTMHEYIIIFAKNYEKIKEIASLHPDLIIVSFGTNEAHSRRYLAQAHKMQIGRLLGMLKAACPEAAFLLTTPPGAYVGRRRARTINPRTVTAARIIKEYAQENKMAVWDMYNIVGGKTDACRNWTKHHMLRADGIHFTPDGYRLQGNLLHQALIKAYNEYVATGLE